jgi:hypothetical protein
VARIENLELFIKHIVIGFILSKRVVDLLRIYALRVLIEILILLVHDSSCRFVLVLYQVIFFKNVVALAARVLEKCLVGQLVLKIHRIDAGGLHANTLATAYARELLEVLLVLLLPNHYKVFDLTPNIHLIFNLSGNRNVRKRYLLTVLLHFP